MNIQAQAQNIADIFSMKFYTIPDNQREYAWKEEHVLTLLNDIKNALDNKEDHYFLGNILVYPGTDGYGHYEVTDGQQRLTTLTIAMYAQKQVLQELKVPLKRYSAMLQLLEAEDFSGLGNTNPRLTLQYEEPNEVLKALLKGETLDVKDYKDESSKKLVRAYETALTFFRDIGKEAALMEYYSFFFQSTYIIKTVAQSSEGAYDMFETTNNRGTGISPVDSLKNLIMKNALPTERPEVKKLWKLVSEVDRSDSVMRFFRYHTIASYDVNAQDIRSDSLYTWYRKNSIWKKNGVLQFVKTLANAANHYKLMLDSEVMNNGKAEANEDLYNMYLFLGTKARQHLIVLLAGLHLTTEQYKQLVKELERVVYTLHVTNRDKKNFNLECEKLYSKLARQLRTVNDQTTFDTFIAGLKAWRQTKSQEFDKALEEMSLDNTYYNQVRYTLVRLEQYANYVCAGQELSTRGVYNKRNNKKSINEVEHILPKNPSCNFSKKFDKPSEHEKYSQMLGNLGLIEQYVNSSIQDKDYAEKTRVYGGSSMTLMKSLGGAKVLQGKQGSNRYDKGVRELGLESYTDWTSNTIVKRQDVLKNIARKVWLD